MLNIKLLTDGDSMYYRAMMFKYLLYDADTWKNRNVHSSGGLTVICVDTEKPRD